MSVGLIVDLGITERHSILSSTDAVLGKYFISKVIPWTVTISSGGVGVGVGETDILITIPFLS